ncbi:MAG TPA: 50S ribosomal protein L10 [Oligoflexia bacterium]|nr:50S ribosomal protein L10 [Oligoflexia bacterium]HMP26396.1 50S ribosomal protein L10 [Oligoflexia bacterium]
MDKQAKTDIISQIEASYKAAQLTLCADYRGLTVAQITKLRKEIRAVGGRAVVVKNTLAKLATKNIAQVSGDSAAAEKFHALFSGPSMIVFGVADPIAPVKAIVNFAKENEKLSLKGGWFENTYIDSAGLEALSKLPSKEEVLAKLLALINAPAVQLLRLLKAPAEQTVRVIEAQRKKLEG